MNENIRNYLGIAGIIALVLIAFAAVRFVGSYAQSIQPTSFRSFSVAGDGKVVAVPDIARFTFSVISEGGKNIADLQKQNTDKVNKAIAYLKGKKIGENDITTQQYNVDPRYQYFNCTAGRVCPPTEIVGYTVAQMVAVKIRDFNLIGDVLAGVVQNGANSVSQLQFTIDDPTEVQNQARAKAIAKAKAKAKDIAQAGDFALGRLLSIEEGYPVMPLYDAYTGYGRGGGAEMKTAPAPNIEPGSQEVVVSVTLKYEID